MSKPVQVTTLSRADVTKSIVIIAFMFFMFGFVTWINAILIPYFKIGCELNHFQSYLVAFSFYIAYLVMSLPAAYLLKRVGFKKGMMLGFFVMATGAFMFVPAGITRTYILFLSGLFIIGIGLAILQTAVNPYVTILGHKERAAQRFSVMGICNKLAGIIGPLLFAVVILRPTDGQLFKEIATLQGPEKQVLLDELIGRVVSPYAVVGTLLLLLGVFINYSPLPEIDTDTESEDIVIANQHKNSIWDFPYLILGAVAIFFHVGSQVIAVDSVISYAGENGVPFLQAKTFPSYILTATIIGYLLGLICVPRFISQLTALKICTIAGLVFSLLILLNDSVWMVVTLGFANSMIWAGIWPLALNDLGRFIKVGASALIMALCGNAIMPLGYGYLADEYGMRTAYCILIPCYLYLIFYAFYGHTLKTWKLSKYSTVKS